MKFTGHYFDLTLNQQRGLSVVDFKLEESFNTLSTLTIHFVSEDPLLNINALILGQADFSVYREGQLQRRFVGVISTIKKGKTGFHRTFYTVIIRPSLWLLTQRHTSRLFNDKTIPQVLEQFLHDYRIQFQCRFDDHHEARSLIMQRREYDFDFFDRLCAEEGLVYWFETTDEGQEICHITDTYLGFKRGKNLRVEYQENAQNKALDNVMTDLTYEINMTVQAYHGKDRKYRYPNTYHHHRTAGEIEENLDSRYRFYDSHPQMPSPENSDILAEYRLEALQNHAITALGKSNYCRLQPGKCFRLNHHPDSALNQRWQPYRAIHRGTLPQSLQEDGHSSDAATIESELWFIPDDRTWRPLAKPKPTAEGPETALVIGPEGEEIYTNDLGEVLVQFHWDLEKKTTCWVRVAQDWSGDNFGFYAIPRMGQEVVISYLEGDTDKPIIIGSVYNGADRHPLKLPGEKTNTIIKTKMHRGTEYNELRFDDTTNEVKTYIHSTPGASQLTLGVLSHPRNFDGIAEIRGKGFELRTDEHGAIRAAKGLYVSANERSGASSHQLDLEEAIEQLQSALSLAQSLSQTAKMAEARPADIADQKKQLNEVYQTLAKPGILASAPEGLAFVTPKSAQISAQNNLTLTAGQHTDLSTQKDFRVAAGHAINLFAIEEEIKLAANKGKVEIQAQNNDMEIYADKNLKIISSMDRIEIAAKKEILLTSGKAYIKIADGNIFIHAPGKVETKSASQSNAGPASMDYHFRSYDPGNDEMFVVKDKSGNFLPNFKYRIEREDGEVFYGVTNAKGETIRVQTGEKKLGLKLFKDNRKQEETNQEEGS